MPVRAAVLGAPGQARFDPQRDVPSLADRAVEGDLDLEALDDLRAGRTLRTLLIP